jgi:hypothetical protein
MWRLARVAAGFARTGWEALALGRHCDRQTAYISSCRWRLPPQPLQRPSSASCPLAPQQGPPAAPLAAALLLLGCCPARLPATGRCRSCRPARRAAPASIAAGGPCRRRRSRRRCCRVLARRPCWPRGRLRSRHRLGSGCSSGRRRRLGRRQQARHACRHVCKRSPDAAAVKVTHLCQHVHLLLLLLLLLRRRSLRLLPQRLQGEGRRVVGRGGS